MFRVDHSFLFLFVGQSLPPHADPFGSAPPCRGGRGQLLSLSVEPRRAPTRTQYGYRVYTRTVYFVIIAVRKDVIGGVTMAVTHLSISCSKSKNVSRQQQHHTERFDAERKHRNKMIDPDKSKDNINLRPDLEGSYQDRFESIVNSDRYKGRRKKDGTPVIAENGKNAAVKMIQVTVNIGRADENGKRLDDLSDDEITELLKNDVYPMMKEWFGGDANVIGAAIHRDESKPHLHLDIVPITEDGKLSAKKMLGNENNMRFHQKEWLEQMQERRPDLNFQRKQNQKANGVEMEKLKELTAQAEEHGNDVAYNVLTRMHKQEKAKWDKEWERIKTADKALDVKAKEVAEKEQKNDATRDELNAFIKPLKSASGELVKKTRDVDKRERELNERETTLNERESTLEERADKLAMERTQGRERELNERETTLNERESRIGQIKSVFVGVFKQLPKIKDTLIAYMKKAREKDEEERKAREEQAERLAEITDVKTEQLAKAIESEDIEQVAKHTEHLEQINEVSTEIDESQFEMSADTLESKIDDFDFDESQFDMSNQNQRTL